MPSFYCKIISSRLNRLLVLMYGSWFRRKLRSRDESVWTSIFFLRVKKGMAVIMFLKSKRILWQYCCFKLYTYELHLTVLYNAVPFDLGSTRHHSDQSKAISYSNTRKFHQKEIYMRHLKHHVLFDKKQHLILLYKKYQMLLSINQNKISLNSLFRCEREQSTSKRAQLK